MVGSACPKEMSQEEAEEALWNAGCPIRPGENGVKIDFDDPRWVISGDECSGTCSINSETEEVRIDPNIRCAPSQ